MTTNLHYTAILGATLYKEDIENEWQRSDDDHQVRTLIKKGCFSDFELLEIHHKINKEQDSNTTSDTPNIDKQQQSNWNEPLTSENRNNTGKQHRPEKKK